MEKYDQAIIKSFRGPNKSLWYEKRRRGYENGVKNVKGSYVQMLSFITRHIFIFFAAVVVGF